MGMFFANGMETINRTKKKNSSNSSVYEMRRITVSEKIISYSTSIQSNSKS